MEPHVEHGSSGKKMAGTDEQMCQNCGNMVKDINNSIVMGNMIFHKTARNCADSESKYKERRRVIPGHVLRGQVGNI